MSTRTPKKNFQTDNARVKRRTNALQRNRNEFIKGSRTFNEKI